MIWVCVVLSVLANNSVSAVRENNAGVQALKEEKVGEGIGRFAEALIDEPENAGIHLNLGIAFEIQEDAVRALKSYQMAEKFAKTDEEKFISNFNIARVHAAAQNLPAALEHYQRALDIAPNSYETKVNIEMLIQSQQGGGGGEGNQDQEDEKKDDKDQKFKDNPKPTPIPFQSKKLSKRDVQKIFEELLQQEQKIRKDVDRKNAKEKPRDKDW